MPGASSECVVWEPCANRGYMVDVLKEYYGTVWGTDVQDYGAGFPVCDFFSINDSVLTTSGAPEIDFIVTNPPFNKFTEFVEHWYLQLTQVRHLYLLARSSITEGVDRYERLFSGAMNPVHIYQYVERVPIVQGGLDPKAGTAMPYCWLHWDRQKPKHQRTRYAWIPPSKKQFNREEDWPND
jgi:hypothetical protein